MFVNVESKKNVASLPSGAVGKGPFAERSWQIRSATLGKIFPARVFAALPSVFAQGTRQRKFFLKIKKRLCRRPLARGSRHKFFQKNRKTTFADGLCQGLSAQVFSKKNPYLPTALFRGRQQ
jgi:hypothetical protein